MNILAIIPNKNDATSFYRGYFPLGNLKRNFKDVNIIVTNQVGWAELAMVDLVFMQRPYDKQHLRLANLVKENGIPLVVDYDDDLFSVPYSNPAFDLYSSEETQMTIGQIVAMADHVTVSTHYLKTRLLKLNSNITVVQNALDEKRIIARIGMKPKGNRNNVIAWRGSDTHNKDISFYGKPITNILKDFPEWHQVFIGCKPWFLGRYENLLYQKPMDIIEYFHGLDKIKPSALQVPLYDDEFNRSKSNIAWLEATMAGAVCICPSFPQWKVPGALNYTGTENYYSLMKSVIKGEVDINKNVEESMDYIFDELTLAKQNQIRYNVFKDLI